MHVHASQNNNKIADHLNSHKKMSTISTALSAAGCNAAVTSICAVHRLMKISPLNVSSARLCAFLFFKFKHGASAQWSQKLRLVHRRTCVRSSAKSWGLVDVFLSEVKWKPRPVRLQLVQEDKRFYCSSVKNLAWMPLERSKQYP